ncbi:hypothetical protein BGZ65_011088 [Modicella reniformis]|uniref:Uncharacterized protein n=1 Tax=Modicella reniformis TaxID=1440133 RepID=A0A9P6MJT3_9FUNG|nr:hypothetical protein BGZ65_011088 [Modicella reniformis]
MATQIFRTESSSKTTTIPTRLDNKSGKRIVLWKDIQQYFKHADGVLNNGEAVVFLTNENFEYLDPLRIAHHPGVVLVIRGPEHEVTESIKTGPASQTGTTTVKDAMNELFERLQVEMNKNKALEEQMLRTQQSIETKQDETQQRLVEMRQQIEQIENKQQGSTEMQKQALDRLAVIQNRIHALITQTNELHEHPLPRLFIVLPKAIRGRDKTRKAQADQFQVYFLCECGAYTISENGTNSPTIHLSNHEGYDLEKPTEFFEKYGTYVLALMYMIKHGVKVGDVVVPSLADLATVGGLDAGQKQPDHLKNIGSLVDDSITFLQSQKYDNIPEGGESMELAITRALEGGVDLQHLGSFLKAKSEHALGNLHRVITNEGHVKYMCDEHCRHT